jgi:tetratricopeptide (TPR) repeat protein
MSLPRVGHICWLLIAAFSGLVVASGLMVRPCRAQGAGNSPSGTESPEELRRIAESYETFLRGPVPRGTPRSKIVEVEAHLGTVYFLLHRYQDSLHTLEPLSRQESQPITSGATRTPDSQAQPLRAQVWLVIGLDDLELNHLPQAITTLRHALAIQPKNANARLALGDALARSHLMEDASKEYETQTKLTPGLADAWYKLGLAHGEISADLLEGRVSPDDQAVIQLLTAEEFIAKGEPLNAARFLFLLLRQHPAMPEAHAELGTALLELGYSKAAEEHFRNELTRNSESPLALLGLAQIAALRADWNEVSAEFEHLNTSNPQELARLLDMPPSSLVVEASSAGKMKLPEDFADSPAGTTWKAWVEGDAVRTISSEASRDSGQACQAAGTTPELLGVWQAQTCYERLIERLMARKELSFTDRAKLAEAEFRLGRYAAALHTSMVLHAAQPRSGWGIYWMSKSHAALAEACFLKVAQLNPDSVRVHQMLADHYLKLSDYPKAKMEYEQAIHLAPNLPDLHLGLGTVWSRTGDWQDAEKEFKTTLDLAPESAFAHYRLGDVYVQESRWSEAIEQLRAVPRDSTALLSARLDLATAEDEVGETNQAIQDLSLVAGLDHGGEAYFRLASLYRKAGDQERARQALDRFKLLRAAALNANEDELGGLEIEQTPAVAGTPRSR